MEQDEIILKFIMVGESGVGKTSIVTRLINNIYIDDGGPTIGIDFSFYNIKYNNQKIKIQLWDTAGQERFYNIVRTYFKKTIGVIYVFDITNKDTFNRLSYWTNKIQEFENPLQKNILIANKCDNDNENVSMDDINNFCKTHKCKYFKISAKNDSNDNIKQPFISLTYDIMDKYQISPSTYTNDLNSGLRIANLKSNKNKKNICNCQ